MDPFEREPAARQHGYRPRVYYRVPGESVWRPMHPEAVAAREPGSMTRTLIIANIVVFFLQILGATSELVNGLGVMQPQAVVEGQVWRLFTATYLHAGLLHLFVNMLGLFFLGPALERVWGPRRFFWAYTAGGIAGNLIFTAASLVGWIGMDVIGVGASGSVLTVLGAAAVLFPRARVWIYFLFPMRLGTFAALYTAWMVWNVVTQGPNYGGDLCHLAGLAVGWLWARGVTGPPRGDPRLQSSDGIMSSWV